MTDVRQIAPLGRSVDVVVRPPGSKSFTNRALVVSSLAAGGVSRLEDPLDADDTVVMRDGLRKLGVSIDDNDDPWLVLGPDASFAVPAGTIIDARASGTTARFLTAVAALAPEPVTIDGTERMRRRPIGHLLAALQQMGADVQSAAGYPPVTIRSSGLHGGTVDVDMTVSSQFTSAVLMIAPMVGAPVTVRIIGETPVSRPYLTSTIEVMTAFGADVEERGDEFIVAPSGYSKTHYAIEADASAAVYPLVAAAITGGVAAIEGIPPGSTQPDLALVEVLESMGCTAGHSGRRLTLVGPLDPLRPVDVDMTHAPDAALALAVAAVFADGPSRIRGLGTLRIKETDRLAALEQELTRIGSDASIEGDDLLIRPGPVHPARIETYDDHRMAMAFSLVGLREPGIEIVDPGCVAKTWPRYFDMLDAL